MDYNILRTLEDSIALHHIKVDIARAPMDDDDDTLVDEVSCHPLRT